MSNVVMTARSRVFRRKAAELGRLVEAETDPERIFPLIQQALSWIQMAENEEALADSDDDAIRSDHNAAVAH